MTNAKIVDSFNLRGEPKYKNFNNFDYVNPNATKGGTITLPDYGTFDNFNPHIFKGIASSQAFGLTVETLGVSPIDDQTSLYPLIAKQFELPEDKSFIGFIIDKKAKFNNGLKITAEDVIFSFESLINKGAPIYKMYYSDIEKVEKITDNHVRFIFKKNSENKELPLIVGQIPIFSKKDFKDRDFSTPSLIPPLGSGPYIIEKFEQGKYINLKKSPNYWAKKHPTRVGHFNFNEVKFDYYSDTSISIQALFSNNIDAREEYTAKIWATGYDNNLIKNKNIIKENIKHNKPAPLQNFAFNLRKEKFQDKRVRQAIGLAFDFEWANKNLFYNQYKRLNSYFTNTGFEYTKFKNPEHNNYKQTRENLKQAVLLLNQAGYDFINGKMTNIKTNKPLSFEIFDNSANGSSFTRVMLPFINNLKKIGIDAKFRSLEVNIFKNRLDNFDYDIAILSYPVSKSPGNELKEYFGSKSADIKGSFNILGIKNPKVDDLINQIITAQTQKKYSQAIKNLDEILLNEHYMILNWFSPTQRIAYWDKFEHPKTDIKTGFMPHTWWIKNE
ncbi:MAG: extracellular solute-binding protein [Alphaproteobacteria bacterium]